MVSQYHRNLAPPLASFLTGVRQQCPAEFDRVFAAVAKSYVTRDYTFDEFSKALQSLVEAATVRDAPLGSIARRESDIALGNEEDGEPLILYVNPTCDECARVVSLVVKTEKVSQIPFPPVLVRLLPSHEDDSLRAAELLEILRQRDRGVFTNALLDVLQTVPEGKASVDTAIDPYMKPIPASDSEDWRMAARRLDEDARALSAMDIPPPFGAFRGHRVARYRSARIPFDTFHDADALILAISAIRAAEHTREVCPAEKTRNKP